MKNLGFFLAIFLSVHASAQTALSGTITDAVTGEALIGATIIYGKGEGTATDMDGNYSFLIQQGERNIQVSYVGYKTVSRKVSVSGKTQTLDCKLETILLNEVQVVADIARDRETPVAFTTIPMKKVQEDLASQDIPMLLNTTPGVYATEQGEDGEPRVTIRGFSQRNVAVLIDGIPVNDMQNGKVYWSNWFGLDAVLSNVQVQRGLGASKIAIPSVGGTINYFTKGTGNRKGGSVKQEVSSGGYFRTSAGYNSGKLGGGWGFTLAASFKTGNGYIDHTPTTGYFYYGKLQKTIGNHVISLSAMGAPQKHGQRSFKNNLSFYDTTYAKSLGVPTSSFKNELNNMGVKHNKHWGLIDRWGLNANGDTIHRNEELNERQNYYHKPQFSLRDFWSVNEKFYVSNVTYLSIGSGGGVGLSGQTSGRNSYLDNDKLTQGGYIDFQSIYDANSSTSWIQSEPISSTVLASMVNNHFWYGWLSTLSYSLSDKSSLSGGVDFRKYNGEHYKEVYDLLGGNYIVSNNGGIEEGNDINKKVGDKFGWHDDGLVKWASVFSQYEYNTPSLSAFASVSGTNTAYKRIDYFKTKQEQETDWKWIKGFAIKSGVNKNLDEFNNVFFNVGYISKAPRFENVYYYDNSLFKLIENEQVKAIEGGYSFRLHNFIANANAYYTVWENKPKSGGISVEIDEIRYRANINGMDALHKGMEIDFAYNATRDLTIEGLMSLGDWKWNSNETVRFTDENNQPLIDPNTGEQAVRSFYAKGVHVADAAQNQFALSIRYEPIKFGYVKLRGTYFGKNFAEFDPLSLDSANAGTDSWKIPDYQLFDLHCGYSLALSKKYKLSLKFSILNMFDGLYISDAQNNDSNNSAYQDFDAKSAGVFIGYGRRYSLSARFIF